MSRSPDDENLLQDLQDSLAAAVQPAELGAELRDRMRRRTLELAREQPPEGTRTLREAEAVWIEIAPFVEVRELRRDEVAGTHTSLMRMRPGGFVPGHRHEREEEFIVLEGECHIGTHKLVAGDVHIAPAGTVHEPVTTQTGVLVLLRGEYPHPTPLR
ncbi:MAG TPA: cupin domain-containing protein [Steroidobacteraceae bacterium]|nr:cupin domain-containing protein [Steroidobacteraceae bacterium]